jgi:hypothetical protein
MPLAAADVWRSTVEFMPSPWTRTLDPRVTAVAMVNVPVGM